MIMGEGNRRKTSIFCLNYTLIASVRLSSLLWPIFSHVMGRVPADHERGVARPSPLMVFRPPVKDFALDCASPVSNVSWPHKLHCKDDRGSVPHQLRPLPLD